MNGIWAVYYRELLILRRRLVRIVGSMAVAPVLYLLAFGLALSDTKVDGRPYLAFLLPGLVALSTMIQAWSIASEINIARFYWKVFDEIQAAPVSRTAYVGGEVLAGATRGLLGAVVIAAIGLGFGVQANLIHWAFWLAVWLNALIFGALAVAAAMLVRTHSDQFMLTNFIITPMAFLAGTFFPPERLPQWARTAIELLPLTHAARAMRSAALGQGANLSSLAQLALLTVACFLLAWWSVGRSRD